MVEWHEGGLPGPGAACICSRKPAAPRSMLASIASTVIWPLNEKATVNQNREAP